MNADWRARSEVAVEAAERAAQLALKYFPEDRADFAVHVEWKANRTPVSVADREAEALLREVLLGAFPDDAFLGEESGEKPGSTGFRWIVDPIDGTRSYVRGIPLWATLVGLEHRGEQIAGVAVVPALRTTYRALRGDGAYRGSTRLRVSETATLGESLLFYSSLSWFLRAGAEERFHELSRRTERQRGFGDFYGFVLVAQGSGEVMVEHGVHPWDVAATKVIIEEAGGRFTDWDGNATIYRPDVVASNGRLHEQVLQILKGP